MSLNKTEYNTTATIDANISQKYTAYPDENLMEKIMMGIVPTCYKYRKLIHCK